MVVSAGMAVEAWTEVADAASVAVPAAAVPVLALAATSFLDGLACSCRLIETTQLKNAILPLP